MTDPAASPLFNPAAFELPKNVVHVCAGGETPPLLRHAASFASYLKDKADGMPGRISQTLVVERVRDRIGKMWRVAPDDVGFVSNVAEGVSMLCESITWQEGDNICFDGNEYPSVVVPFALPAAGVPEIRLAEGKGPNRILEKVDAHTRVIAVSYVSYLNGERFDLANLRAKADEVGAILVVDYTQAAGYLPIDASIADFAFSACYKWLLGITGCLLEQTPATELASIDRRMAFAGERIAAELFGGADAANGCDALLARESFSCVTLCTRRCARFSGRLRDASHSKSRSGIDG